MKLNLDPELTAYKQTALLQVDQSAEEERLKHMTVGSAQALVYLMKEQEARAYRSTPSASVPHLISEAAIRGISLKEMVTLVLTRADAWKQSSVAIEANKMRKKLAIERARSVGEIHTIITRP